MRGVTANFNVKNLYGLPKDWRLKKEIRLTMKYQIIKVTFRSKVMCYSLACSGYDNDFVKVYLYK